MSILQVQPAKRDWRGFGLFCLLGSITFASQKFLDMRLHELWIPVGLTACISFWFASLPKLKPVVGWIVAVLFFGTLCTYTSSQGSEFSNAPQVALLSGLAELLSIGILIALATTKKVRRLVMTPVILVVMACLICYFSGGRGATDGLVDFLMRTLGLDRLDAESLNLAIRKCIHITFYGLIGALAYRLCQKAEYKRPAFFMSLLLVAIFGSFDEIRQSTDPSRLGTWVDVCLDVAAGATFIAWLRLKAPIPNPVIEVTDVAKLTNSN